MPASPSSYVVLSVETFSAPKEEEKKKNEGNTNTPRRISASLGDGETSNRKRLVGAVRVLSWLDLANASKSLSFCPFFLVRLPLPFVAS